MKKIFLLIISVLMIVTGELISQTWKEMIDSCNAYQQAQDYQAALKWALQAEVKAKEEFGEIDTNYVSTAATISIIYYYLGNLDSAINYGGYCLSISRKLFNGVHPYLANYISNLAYFYNNRGNYKHSELLLKEALDMYRLIYNGDHPFLANSISGLAVIYDGCGNYEDAELLFKEALEMYRRIFKSDNTYLAMSINNMAMFYIDRDKYKDAEPLLKEALDMYRRIFKGDHPDLAMSINNMAGYYNGRGNYKDAEPLLKDALDMYRRIFKGDHLDLARSINNMASYYDSRGYYNDAELLYIEALEMYRRILKGDHPDLAKCINNLAVFYNDRNNDNEAEQLLKEALDMYRRIFKNDHIDLASNINNMAYFYYIRDNYREAEPLYNEALEMYRRIFKGDHPYLAGLIKNMAYFYNGKGDFSKAKQLFIEALNINKNIFLKQSSNLSESEKEKYWNTMKNNFESFFTFVITRYIQNPDILSYSFDNLLFTKALQFNSTNKIKKRILESNDSLLKAKYIELLGKRERLIKLYSLPTKEVEIQGYNIDSIESVANDLEKEISLKSEDFKQSYEKKKVTWKLIQGFLKPDEAAIEMVRFRLWDKRRWTDTIYYAALIITDQTTENPDIVILENGKEIEDLYYAKYRNSVKLKENDNESFKVFWQKIYEKTKEYKKIYFSPDGIYNKLNIGTFLLESGKYLIDLQKIHQLNSSQDILLGYYSKQDEVNVYNSAVLIGNPDFTLSQDKVKEKERSLLLERDAEERGVVPSRSIPLSPLPGTEKEVDNITKYLKSKNWIVNKFTKADAVKAAIKSANNPRVLHIATHGLFLSDIKPDDRDVFGMETKRMIGNPLLRSGLFFAGASSTIGEDFRPSGYDNGFLTAYEAMNLNLDKTELVVLSACETGLGEIKNGEGVYGLQRAFIQAGAKSVIMSLWSVSDDATQELMSTFYKEWLGGKTKREAFRIAQMKLKEKYTYPYYWGAFVMVGE